MHNPTTRPASSNFKRLERRLLRQTGQAIGDFGMIEEGDRVMVCLSGGKDSYTLLDMLMSLQKRAPVRFELLAMNLDQKQPGFPADVLPDYLRSLGVEHRIVEEDTYSIVVDKIAPGKTTCSLCSRLRRGIIYRTAAEWGASKIALGHHREDIVETLFLNLFHGGRVKAMPPKLVSDNGRHVVIRPLAYCAETDIARYARARQYPIIPCDLCGSQPNLQRQQIKSMLAEWERVQPGRTQVIFSALQRVSPSHLLDRALHDFRGLAPGAAAAGEGDTLFDPPILPVPTATEDGNDSSAVNWPAAGAGR